MSEKEKKKQIAKITVFITSIFVIFLSVTYGFINLTLFGTKRQVITVGDLKLDLDEKNELTISNALPMYDEVGLIQEKGFTFDLINEGDKKTGYVLKLEEIEKEGVAEEKKLSESIVRYGLIKGKDTTVDYISSIKGKDYAIDEGEIGGKETISYELKLWIAYEVTDNSAIKNKSLSYRVKVEATQEIIKAKYTVNFNTGVSDITEESLTVIEGEPYESLPKPKRYGYRFLGWYEDEEGNGERVTEEQKATKNQELYAKWEELYQDGSGANIPEITSGMIPVVYQDNQWKVVDGTTEWYNYDTQNWANVVTVPEEVRDTYLDDLGNVKKEAVGEDITNVMTTMFVWIPRYSYSIKSEDNGTNYFGKQEVGRTTSTSQEAPGEIDVHFIEKEKKEEGSAQYTTNIEGTWRTPDGLDFGGEKLSGIWVGKFAVSHKTLSSSTEKNNLNCIENKENCSSADELEILPNKLSLRYNNVANLFYGIKNMQRNGNPFGFETNQNKVDLHMMKNSEWGVVAYLSQSKYGKYGNSSYKEEYKEIYKNDSSDMYTGRSIGTIPKSITNSPEGTCRYDNITDRNDGTGSCGGGASTTGNITGIYDTKGASFKYVMAVVDKTSLSSGFSESLEELDEKYYDSYDNTTFARACAEKPCYGHAMPHEIKKWYGSYAKDFDLTRPWITRSSFFDALYGIYTLDNYTGEAATSTSSMAVITVL